ncbi:MAG: DNA topoisomerase I [Candidatus Anstonellaceae archaeon]
MKFVICEKPNAAEKIASAIGKGKAKAKKFGEAKYWVVNAEGEEVIVASAVGHLYSLKQISGKWFYPVFDVEWAPIYEVEKNTGFQKPYLDAIKELSKGAEEYICACDFDTEGTLIGYNILRFACGKESGSRMKFSTLTQEELEASWLNRGEFDFENALAGEARHMLDWFYGINLSRALMACLRMVGEKRIMSIGRVQGPALALLAKREKEIASFVSTPYWEVWCKCKGVKFEHEHGRFAKKEEAESALARSMKSGKVVKIERKEHLQPPAPAFDLTSLQVEAHSALGIDPKTTLEIAQRLYESALISYPRTSSQKLPAKLDLKKIIKSLSSYPEYSSHAKRLLEAGRISPIQGKKDDPAHPAIHPTGQKADVELAGKEKQLYDLIVRRFLACFDEPAVRETQKVVVSAGSEKYFALGKRTLKEGWFKVYAPYLRLDEVSLPEFKEGEQVLLEAFEIEKKKTQPPKRYTPASIVSELEKRGLGTKATRASIIDTLFKRGYIEGESIRTTPFGMAVYEVLSKSAPEILDEKLTQDIEKGMEKIKDGENEKNLIEKGKRLLLAILKKFENNEKEIGLGLLAGLRRKESGESIVGACPKCGAEMRIIKMDTGKQFLGCSNYPKCTNAYPLPSGISPKGVGKQCEQCKAPIVKWISGKRKIEVCPNPSCRKEESNGKDGGKDRKPKAGRGS